MTTHHLGATFPQAVCGQVADGKHHTNEIAAVLRAMFDVGGFDICLTCVTAALEQH